MRERVARLTGGAAEGMPWLGTFHATGAKMLRRHAELAGLKSNFTILEKDRAALDALQRNIDRLGAGERADIRAQAVEHVPPPPEPYDLILIDPPYRSGLAQPALDRAAPWLARGGWLSVETHGEDLSPPEPLTIGSERSFGKARLTILRNEA